jgi:hypothetical protein
VLTADGESTPIGRRSKEELADAVLDLVISRLSHSIGEG